MTKPRAVWLKTKKTKAAFMAGAPTTQQKPVSGNPTQTTQLSPAPAPLNQGTQLGNRSHTPHQVDCTKPIKGEPHTRIHDCGREKHWCTKCPNGGCWGNHLTDSHADWLKSFLEYKAKQQEKAAQKALEQAGRTETSGNQGSSNQGESTVGSMHRGSANVSLPSLSALFRRTYVTFDDSSDEDSV